MKFFVIFLILIGSSGLIISQASGAYVEFDNGVDKIIVNNKHIMNFQLNWSSEDSPSGKITFDEPINETILLQIPKSIPRTTNLDFGHFSLHAIQTDGSWIQIKETESECFYILEIPVNDSDYVEIVGTSVSAGRWAPVSILNQACGEFSLKQQIENKMSALEIECKNEKHVLAERPNGKLSCVYYETSEKLNWSVINADTNRILFVYEVPVNGTLYDVEYTIKGGTVTNMMQMDGTNSLLITIDSNKDGEITLHIPHGVIDPIPKHSGDSWLFVLVNGEEVEFEQDVDDELNRIVSLKFNHPDPEIELIASYWT